MCTNLWKWWRLAAVDDRRGGEECQAPGELEMCRMVSCTSGADAFGYQRLLAR